jgi:hypothetical protein
MIIKGHASNTRDLTLTISGAVKPGENESVFIDDAEKAFKFLRDNLPSGTFDRVKMDILKAWCASCADTQANRKYLMTTFKDVMEHSIGADWK